MRFRRLLRRLGQHLAVLARDFHEGFRRHPDKRWKM
jgi:hypothetical protein